MAPGRCYPSPCQPSVVDYTAMWIITGIWFVITVAVVALLVWRIKAHKATTAK
jgi:hypothetical protein